jgi:outer membrane protein assembly factor BamB
MIWRLLAASLAAALCGSTFAQDGDWAGHRGDSARTGNVDGKPGPASKPSVLWVYRSKEHFLAPPAAGANRLFMVVMGAFNTGALRAFELAEGKPPVWSKGAPIVRLPTVGTPAVAGGKVVFGEGMHQTDGTSLHCVRASDGRSLWRLDVTGELVHIEASPAIDGGRVYVGAGAAGVLCADMSRVTLDGKDLSIAEGEAEVEKKWKAMADQYEVEKKKDPDFAIPPNEANLPRPAPKLVWQKGQGAWHVDAPVLVEKGRVYVASAFLEKEKLGERVLACLNAADGAEVWKAPLRHNAWGGATACGELLLVPGSTMRYDPKELGSAKGEVVAIKAADGSVAWRRDLPGAVLATVAVAGGAAIVCDSSGQVTALDAKSGQPRWSYKGGHPFFAGAALAGELAYVADIEGVVHAVGLADGKLRWKLDLGADPTVKAPGMVYGSPVVHGGRLYVATANLEGKASGGETVVVCIGEGK